MVRLRSKYSPSVRTSKTARFGSIEAISRRMPRSASVPASDRTMIVMPPAGGLAKSRRVRGTYIKAVGVIQDSVLQVANHADHFIGLLVFRNALADRIPISEKPARGGLIQHYRQDTFCDSSARVRCGSVDRVPRTRGRPASARSARRNSPRQPFPWPLTSAPRGSRGSSGSQLQLHPRLSIENGGCAARATLPHRPGRL